MEVGKFLSFPLPPSLTRLDDSRLRKTRSVKSNSNPIGSSMPRKTSKFKLWTSISTIPSTEFSNPLNPDLEGNVEDEKFDWYSQWYPVMPLCDLDKKVPLAKKVIGLDVVVWYDRTESAWKVFDDACPHRLAPLSEGRIDQWGRLQCVYHGWCFNGSGDCEFIPQAPPDGPPVYTTPKACVSVYPSVVQNDILWFWPSTDPEYKDVFVKKKPPYISDLDDPSYTKLMGNRDIPYGYEILTENLMDPAHVPYAHYGIMRVPQPKNRVKADREGGRPIEMRVRELGIDGFIGEQEQGSSKFMSPCVFYTSPSPLVSEGNGGNEDIQSAGKNAEAHKPLSQRRLVLIFLCIPVSPGKSRLIWAFPRNFALWIDRIFPRWLFHLGQNLILDSDMYLLHKEERKIMEVGPANWQKACFVPTKSDAKVVAFRKWLNRYSGGQVDWRGKFSGINCILPSPPPKEQLMDRYWTHVVNCQSCMFAHKALSAVEIALQVTAVALLGIVAATRQCVLSATATSTMLFIAILCFAASRWLSHFIYKSFYFHDYNHALR